MGLKLVRPSSQTSILCSSGSFGRFGPLLIIFPNKSLCLVILTSVDLFVYNGLFFFTLFFSIFYCSVVIHVPFFTMFFPSDFWSTVFY